MVRFAELLGRSGYVRYEVSNHARPGHACRYNLSVWGQGEYVAFGMGAHGYRDGVRYRRVRRLDTYIERVRSGIGPIQSSDIIEGWNAELERLMLGLRRTAGVRSGEGGAALLAAPDSRLVSIVAPGGMGKTRLAQAAAAAQSGAFLEGVAYISVAPISDARLLATAMVEALAGSAKMPVIRANSPSASSCFLRFSKSAIKAPLPATATSSTFMLYLDCAP